jgi:hypothetical protein
MASISSTNSPVSAPTRLRDYPLGSVAFDWAVALLGFWFVLGVHVDGWAHNNGMVDDTFFTPWHFILYSGVAACGLFLASAQLRYVSQGHSWLKALPKGYLLSLIGVVTFLLGGGFDFWWHETFGFEANREALLSPAHLILAASGVLILLGPVRAAWERTRAQQRQGWLGFAPILIGLSLAVTMITFFLMFANAYLNIEVIVGRSRPSGDLHFLADSVGVMSALAPLAVIMAALLVAVRRWGAQLPFGSVTFVFMLNALLTIWLSLEIRIFPLPENTLMLLAPLAAGLLGDVLLRIGNPQRGGVMLRIFSFIVPLVFVIVFFVIINGLFGMWWRVHMSLGTAFYAGIAGLLLSYVAIPPPHEQTT